MTFQKDVEERVIAWHKAENQSCLKKTLELGDMILDLVALTRTSENSVIGRIKYLAGEYAKSQPTYNRAARLARLLTKNQRAVLIDKCVPLDKCEVLVARHYDSKDRVRIINEIKSGLIKSPWKPIETRRDKRMADKSYSKNPESDGNPDNLLMRVCKQGEPFEEGIIDALKCLITRCGYLRFTKCLNTALMETGNTRVQAVSQEAK